MMLVYSSIVVIVDGKDFTLEMQYHLIVCFIFIVHIQIDNDCLIHTLHFATRQSSFTHTIPQSLNRFHKEAGVRRSPFHPHPARRHS